jgi:hypothetical protein
VQVLTSLSLENRPVFKGLPAHQTPLNYETFAAGQPQPLFGNGMPGLDLFGLLENNPIYEVVLKDILGFNLPKIALTRTWKERFDVATLELSNTAVTVLGTLSLPWLLNKPTQWLSGVDSGFLNNTFKGLLTPKAQLARLGKASGFLFPFAAAFWAAPFFRNALTLRRNKTADYEHIIGLNQHQDDKENYKVEMQKQMKKGYNVMMVGNALGLAGLLGFSLAARRFGGKALGSKMSFLHNTFQLMGGQGNQVNRGLATLIFWLWPAYGGWLHAARSNNEHQEQLLKAANGTLWFSFITPLGVDPIFANRFERVMKENLPQLKNKQLLKQLRNTEAPWWNVWDRFRFPAFHDIALEGPLKPTLEKLNKQRWFWGLGSSILLLSAMPQLLNWVLTKRRFEAEQHHLPLAQRVIQPTMNSPFQTFLITPPERLAQRLMMQQPA